MIVIGSRATLRQNARAAGLALAAAGVVVLALLLVRQAAVTSAAGACALLAAGGLASGFLAGLLGIGGALVTIPLLYLALPGLGTDAGQVCATAVATALAAMIPTTIVASWHHRLHGAIDRRSMRCLLVPMTLGAAIGAMVAARVNGPLLALLFAGQCLVYGARLARLRDEPAPPNFEVRGVGRLPAWLAGSAMAGFCACVGMGGGSLVARYLQQRGLAFRESVATSAALNLCIALGGSAAFLLAPGSQTSMPAANWMAAAVLGGGAVCAAPLGVALAHRLPVCRLRRAVGAVYVLSALALIIQVLRS